MNKAHEKYAMSGTPKNMYILYRSQEVRDLQWNGREIRNGKSGNRSSIEAMSLNTM